MFYKEYILVGYYHTCTVILCVGVFLFFLIRDFTAAKHLCIYLSIVYLFLSLAIWLFVWPIFNLIDGMSARG